MKRRLIDRPKTAVVSNEGHAAINISFLLLDLVEHLIKISDNESARAGVEMKPRTKALFNALKYTVSDLRKTTVQMTMDKQLEFGEMSDAILSIVVHYYDRTTDNFELSGVVIEELLKHKSLRNLKINRLL